MKITPSIFAHFKVGTAIDPPTTYKGEPYDGMMGYEVVYIIKVDPNHWLPLQVGPTKDDTFGSIWFSVKDFGYLFENPTWQMYLEIK